MASRMETPFFLSPPAYVRNGQSLTAWRKLRIAPKRFAELRPQHLKRFCFVQTGIAPDGKFRIRESVTQALFGGKRLSVRIKQQPVFQRKLGRRAGNAPQSAIKGFL